MVVKELMVVGPFLVKILVKLIEALRMQPGILLKILLLISKECLVQVGYAIGVAEPVGLYVNTFGTSNINYLIRNSQVIKNF